MSRVSDNLVPSPLIPTLVVSKTGYSAPVVGLTGYRSFAWNTVSGYIQGGSTGDGLLIALQESDKPTPNSVSRGLIGTASGGQAIGNLETYSYIAIPFTADKDCTVYSVKLALQGVNEPDGYCALAIFNDNGAGSPDIFSPVSGTSNNYYSEYIHGISLSIMMEEVEFKMRDGIDLVDGNIYWIIFGVAGMTQGTINIGYLDVTATGDSLISADGATYVPFSVDKSVYFKLMELNFTDIADTGIAIAYNNKEQFGKSLTVDYSLENRKDAIRIACVLLSLGSWTVSSEILASDAILQPVN